jgi:hypothetical protein
MLFPLTKFCSSRRGQRRLVLSGLAALSGLVCTQAALAANITVASPVNGSTDTSPLWVRAHNVGCNGLAPKSFGYSIDNSATTTMGVTAYDIDATKVSVASGTHTIHFKAWTTAGICPVVNSTIKVAGGTGTATPSSGSSSGSSSSGSGSVSPSIPSNAVTSLDLDTSGGWSGEHDTGTPGSSKGSTLYPATTPLYDDAREFYMTYSGRSGERWHDSFANDASATHFVMDTYVYVTDPTQLANLELDLNQVISNGQTVILGTQCSTYSGTWEYTYYSGGGFHWRSSNVACNPRTWSANTWHHIQLGFHRSGGTVTHDWVTFDGKQSTFSGTTAATAQSLGWAKGTLLMNIQLDGFNASSGSVTAYFHKTTYYRW